MISTKNGKGGLQIPVTAMWNAETKPLADTAERDTRYKIEVKHITSPNCMKALDSDQNQVETGWESSFERQER